MYSTYSTVRKRLYNWQLLQMQYRSTVRTVHYKRVRTRHNTRGQYVYEAWCVFHVQRSAHSTNVVPPLLCSTVCSTVVRNLEHARTAQHIAYEQCSAVPVLYCKYSRCSTYAFAAQVNATQCSTVHGLIWTEKAQGAVVVAGLLFQKAGFKFDFYLATYLRSGITYVCLFPCCFQHILS